MLSFTNRSISGATDAVIVFERGCVFSNQCISGENCVPLIH